MPISSLARTVLKCPAGHAPKSCRYLEKAGRCQLSLDRNLCANCPHKDDCKAKIFKKVSKVNVSIRGTEKGNSAKADGNRCL